MSNESRSCLGDARTHKQVLVLRKDLNMRKGKMVAQGGHGTWMAPLSISRRLEINGERYLAIPLNEQTEPWFDNRFTKITLGVSGEDELLAVYEQARAAGLLCALVQDSGLTEFGGVPTNTCVAIGPDRIERIDAITRHLTTL